MRRIITLLLFVSAPVFATEPLSYYLPHGVAYDPAVPTPEDGIEHPLGDYVVSHGAMVTYLRDLAAASPRVAVETVGYSHERRPILLLTITSPENHTNIDAIRQRHLAALNPKSPVPATGDDPVITWIGAGVHGNEISSMPAAMAVAYHFSAGQGPNIEKILDESVIVILAIHNPDGFNRASTWFRSQAGEVRVTDPAHKEHNDSAGYWPGGRTNHYWFDLNRQWVVLTQPESKAWMAAWQKWRPTASVDLHEQGIDSPYFFSPGEPAQRNPYVPDETFVLQGDLSNAVRGVMDDLNELYFTEEFFDDLNPAMGSNYPLLTGTVSFLFENAGFTGRSIETVNGIQTFERRIRRHSLASIAFAEGAVARRDALLRHQRESQRQAIEEAARDRVEAYVFQAPRDPVRTHLFVDTLLRHGIDVRPVTRAFDAEGLTYRPGQAYVVTTEQPAYRLIKNIFETRTEFGDVVFYDASTWTLPLAYNLEYAELSSAPRNVGDVVESITFPSQAPPSEAGYAYAFAWDDFNAPKAAYRLLDAGVKIRVAKQPVVLKPSSGSEVNLGYGAIYVPLNPGQTITEQDIHEIIVQAAVEDGVAVHTVDTGKVAQGPDFGALRAVGIEKPSVLLVTGGSVRGYDAGEIWHLLDNRMEIDVTLRDVTSLGGLDWSRYTHLILPDGTLSELGEDQAKDIDGWVKGGGTLVASKRAALWAVKNGFVKTKVLADEVSSGFGSLLATSPQDQTENAEAADNEPPAREAYATKEATESNERIRGAIFQVDVDTSHPMGFGYRKADVASYKDMAIILARPDNPYASVAVYADDPLLSGFASAENIEKMQEAAMMIAERRGQGSVILFTDNMNFRAHWLGTSKLFLNSLFFSKVFTPEGARFEQE